MIQKDFVEISGIKINQLTLQSLLERVESFILSGGHFKVMYVNVHCMNIAFRDSGYKKILNSTDLLYCDGAGIVLAARILKKHLPERMTGADWIYNLCKLCSDRGYSIFLLGGEEKSNKKARDVLINIYPELRIVGLHHGYFSDTENQEIIARINKSKPDILLIGMGTPKQEYWVDQNFSQLNVPVVWTMGAVMDFVSEKVPRAPGWMLNNGMEWLFRLAVEPGRMWKRYLVGNILFMTIILIESAKQYLGYYVSQLKRIF